MKALTLTNPWAVLVAIGAKGNETRSWKTDYRGALIIHAAKGWKPNEWGMVYQPIFDKALQAWKGYHLTPATSKADLALQLANGCVLARANLIECLPVNHVRITHNLTAQERAFGDYSPGRFAWVFEGVELIEPKPARGALGLWDYQP